MRTSAIFGAKYFELFEIYDESARTREMAQCGHFSDKKGAIFHCFVRMCFMDILQCKSWV